jgi:hypothetical protein
MQTDFSEKINKQQQDYQKSRDPFQYGQQVAQRRYSEIMAGLENKKNISNQAYGDLFQQFQQQSVKNDAMAGQTLSGGMGQQQRDYASAIEMQQMGEIGKARVQANRDLFTEAESAFSNAQLEGQQATQMQLQNEQAELQRVQQRQAIVNSDMSEEEKVSQLRAMGVDVNAEDLKAANTGLIGGWQKLLSGEASASQAVGTVLSSVALLAGGYLALSKGPAIFKFFKGLFTKGGTAAAGSGAVQGAGAGLNTAAQASSTQNIVTQLALPTPRPIMGALPSPIPPRTPVTVAPGQILYL